MENIDGINKTYRLYSPPFFHHWRDVKKDLPLDHTYCRPKLVNLDEEVPLKKTRVLADILLNPGHESAVPNESQSENLIMHELEPLNLSDEQDVNIIEVDNNTRSLQIIITINIYPNLNQIVF
ncbi:hypothetical protein NQ317_008527 [Molorchus minor]|uniref:Uncharacterized protein n=1 Tax=Molorchus minor TaxID=1323400 RepID=A0ABQ9J068_9CUCU|nr:hypothetical protein NQ317_008527 [Molorchus minor]